MIKAHFLSWDVLGISQNSLQGPSKWLFCLEQYFLSWLLNLVPQLPQPLLYSGPFGCGLLHPLNTIQSTVVPFKATISQPLPANYATLTFYHKKSSNLQMQPSTLLLPTHSASSSPFTFFFSQL